MNRLILPVILTATILVAASFAFMPVQRATTTHLPSVAAGSIADGSVTSAKIADGTIAAVDIGAGVITTAEIAANTITGADIAAGGIDAAGDFAAGVVDSAALADAITLPTSLTVGGTGTALTIVKTGTFVTPAGVVVTAIVNDADATTAAIVAASCNADTAAGWRYIVDGTDDAGDGDAIVDFQVVFLADPTDGVACDYLLVRP